jgi:glycosyltransferase involved in cell wall biosynthesis
MGGRAGLLRRGIERNLFHPARRDRIWLAEQYGIPPERFVVMAAGRLNRGKNILLLADAVQLLLRRGVDAQLVCAGDGEDRAAVIERLGARATCPGNVEPAVLARLYASAEIFALPSRIEESANVLLEALASGLPVLVARDSGMGRAVLDKETGLVLPGDDASAWGEALVTLAAQPLRRRAMARAARDYAETAVPSWQDVLAHDLLPHWEEAARSRRRTAA